MEQEFEKEVITRLTRIETKLDDYESTKKVALNADNRSKQNEKDVSEIKDSIKWIVRLVLGETIGIVFLIISMIIQKGIGG